MEQLSLNNQSLQEYLNSIFRYRNGRLYWKMKTARKVLPRTRAGQLDKRGYRIVSVNAKKCCEHRIIWIMHYGDIPRGFQIDHVDGIRNNNILSNLRLSTQQQNVWNSRKSKRNSSGYKGVVHRKDIKTKPWQAIIYNDGISKSLGFFSTPELAHEAYKAKAIELHGEFARY